MKFLTELKALLTALTDWLVLMVVFTLFFFTFSIGDVTVFDRTIPFVVPSQQSFAVDVFRAMRADLAPVGVPVIVTGPLTAFVAQVKVALLLSFIFTFPFLLYRLLRYLTPALYRHEQTLLYRVVVPATALFAGGVAFAYAFIVPTTFRVLYTYADPLGATALLTIEALLGLSIALMLITGGTFTIPVVMVLLSSLRVIPHGFWLKQWRYAVVILLIASAIITPDGSGISMVLLSIPGVLLYGVGAFISGRVERRSEKAAYSKEGSKY